MEEMLKTVKGESSCGQARCRLRFGQRSHLRQRKGRRSSAAKVVAMCDSNGWIYDEDGVDLKTIKRLKEVERKRIKEYVNEHPKAEYHEDGSIWDVPCDVALPCATQNELHADHARTLMKNGVIAVGEGANMPTTLEATQIFQQQRRPVCARQGRQRRRRGDLRAGDVPEQHAPELDVRRGRSETPADHGQYLPQHCRYRQAIWSRRRLRHGREHRGLYEGRQRHAGARHGLRETHCAERRAV